MARNFDSSGLNSGTDMFALMQTTETELLRERSNLFKSLKNVNVAKIENFNQYLLELNSQFIAFKDRLRERSIKLLQKTDKNAMVLIDNEMNKAFKVGVDSTVAEADEVIGEIPKETQKSQEIKERAKQDTRNSQLTALNSTLNDFTVLSGLIIGGLYVSHQLGQNKGVYDIVDEQQRKFNAKGVSGKQVGKRDISLTSYNETVVRENSQQTMLAGGGAVETLHDRVYVSQHASASDACRPHQGKFYIDDVFRKGRRGKYNLPMLSSVIQKKGRPGLFHFNCRHTVTYAPEGFDKPNAPKNAQTNKDGKVNSLKSKQTYEVEQKQRALQRNVRQYKQVRENALTDNERLRADNLVKQNQAKLRQLEQFAKRNDIPFYRQANKEDIEFKFETFKPEF